MSALAIVQEVILMASSSGSGVGVGWEAGVARRPLRAGEVLKNRIVAIQLALAGDEC
jgi:hypothetical protein